MDADIEYTDPTYYDFFIQSSTEIVNFLEQVRTRKERFTDITSLFCSTPPDDQETINFEKRF